MTGFTVTIAFSINTNEERSEIENTLATIHVNNEKSDGCTSCDLDINANLCMFQEQWKNVDLYIENFNKLSSEYNDFFHSITIQKIDVMGHEVYIRDDRLMNIFKIYSNNVKYSVFNDY
jgi:hypothetical protein